MTKEQSLFLGIGEALCEVFGPRFSTDDHYKTLMEGCFTQDSQLMARGLERLVSTHASEVPLFMRGRLFQVSSALKALKLEKALSYAEKARFYSGSLALRTFSAA